MMPGWLATLAAIPGVPAAAGAVGSSVISGLLGQRAQSQQNAAQMSMDKRTREWNTKERYESQHWQGMQDHTNRLFAQQEASKAFNRDKWMNERQYQQSTAATNTAFRRQLFMENTATQRLAEDAKAAGIHPLAALGGAGGGYQIAAAQPGGGGGSPQASAPGGGGVGYSSASSSQLGPAANPMGDALMQGMQLATDFRRSQLEAAEIRSRIQFNEAQTAATVADARSRTIISNARNAAISPGNKSTSVTVEKAVPGARPQPRPGAPELEKRGPNMRLGPRRKVPDEYPGHEVNNEPVLTVPLWKWVKDENGDLYRMPNSEAIEDEATEHVAGVTFWARYLRNNAKRLARESLEQDKKRRKQMLDELPGSPGYTSFTGPEY